MARLVPSLGRRDTLLCTDISVAQQASATTDDEAIILSVPDLSQYTGAVRGFSLPNELTPRGIWFVGNTTLTGQATNFVTLKINVYRAGVKTADSPIAQLIFNTGSVVATAWTPKLIPLVIPDYELKAGDVVTFNRVHTGTGLQAPAGLVLLDYASYISRN